ncbi:MAG: metal ABC transporter permease [Sphaerochaetaceae bacterium]|jgi:manganese/zinc/iron transport system permease protein
MSLLYEMIFDYTLRNVALGTLLLGLGAGAIGSFMTLRGQSLIGDAIAHATLPGVAIAYLLTSAKDPSVLLIGAAIAGVLGIGAITVIIRTTKIDSDGANGIILSIFFGLGLLLLTYIQKLPKSSQAGLDRFIFGQAATIVAKDVVIIAIVQFLVLTTLVLFFKEFKSSTFDPQSTTVMGFNQKIIDFIFAALLVAVIVVGLQTVGVILISALLVAPAAAARQWTHSLKTMVILSSLFSGISGMIGSLISATGMNLPTGPMIVLVLTLFIAISFLFGSKRGVVNKKIAQIKRNRTFDQNRILLALDTLARSHEESDLYHSSHTIGLMVQHNQGIKRVLKQLTFSGLLLVDEESNYALSRKGEEFVASLKGGEGLYAR